MYGYHGYNAETYVDQENEESVDEAPGEEKNNSNGVPSDEDANDNDAEVNDADNNDADDNADDDNEDSALNVTPATDDMIDVTSPAASEILDHLHTPSSRFLPQNINATSKQKSSLSATSKQKFPQCLGHIKTDILPQCHIRTEILPQGHIKTEILTQRHIKTGVLLQRHIKAEMLLQRQGYIKREFLPQCHIRTEILPPQCHIRTEILPQCHIKTEILLQCHIKTEILPQHHIKTEILSQRQRQRPSSYLCISVERETGTTQKVTRQWEILLVTHPYQKKGELSPETFLPLANTCKNKKSKSPSNDVE